MRSLGYFRLIACVFAALSFEAHAAPDIYDAVNRLRTGEGGCVARQKQLPLIREPKLERVAAALARGGKLPESLRAAGYRDTRFLYFSIRGDDVGRMAVPLLEKKYCEQLQDGALIDVGVYQDPRQLWIVMAAPFAPRVALSPEAAARRVLDLVNKARAESRKCGDKTFYATRSLRWSEILARAALAHAEEMAHQDYFSHRGKDGSTPAERAVHAGYTYRAIGENIAGGQSTPEEAVARWIESPTHCANLMQPIYTEMGVAFAIDRNSELGVYWTQVFGAPK